MDTNGPEFDHLLDRVAEIMARSGHLPDVARLVVIVWTLLRIIDALNAAVDAGRPDAPELLDVPDPQDGATGLAGS